MTGAGSVGDLLAQVQVEHDRVVAALTSQLAAADLVAAELRAERDELLALRDRLATRIAELEAQLPTPPAPTYRYATGTGWRTFPEGPDAAWVWASCDFIVVNHSWASLEHAAGRDALLAELDEIERRGLVALLRIGMGHGAPDRLRTMTWTTNKGVGDQSQTYDITIAPYWTREVQDATRAFLSMLGDAVGDHPALAGVAVPMGTQFEEPISPSQLNYGTNLERALGTGWSPDARDAWLMTVSALTTIAFPGQYLYMPLNPPGSLDGDNYRNGNAEHAVALAGRMLDAFGPQLVLGNNSWAPAGEWGGQERIMYEGVKALTPRFGFQTATYAKLGGTRERAALTFRDAVAFGAISVELPRGVQGMDLDDVRAGLRANLTG